MGLQIQWMRLLRQWIGLQIHWMRLPRQWMGLLRQLIQLWKWAQWIAKLLNSITKGNMSLYEYDDCNCEDNKCN